MRCQLPMTSSVHEIIDIATASQHGIYIQLYRLTLCFAEQGLELGLVARTELSSLVDILGCDIG